MYEIIYIMPQNPSICILTNIIIKDLQSNDNFIWALSIKTVPQLIDLMSASSLEKYFKSNLVSDDQQVVSNTV